MVAPAQWHGEFIAHLARKRAVLCEAQMMGIRGPATANQARLFGHEPDVVLVTHPAWLWMGQLAFVDALGNLVRFVLLPGQSHDINSFDTLMAGIYCLALIGDKAFDAHWLREALRGRNIEAVIPLREGTTGHADTSLQSEALPKVASLAWKASSICRASAAVKLFFAPRIRCAQEAASSDEAIASSSVMRRSRSGAEASALRIGSAECERIFPLR